MTTYADPELEAQHREPRRRRSRLTIVLAVLVGVTLVGSHGKYNTLSARYDTQTTQVKGLTGQVKSLKGNVSDLHGQVKLGKAAGHAAVLMTKATDKLLTGYNKDIYMQLLYIEEARTFVDQAARVAKSAGYPDIASLLRAAAAGAGSTI
jgi:outer membrane murein-binding lipoprotein Lpp